MKTEIILNLKGGVAKTATAVNVAAILAKDYNQRVLLIDADSQCNATEFYGGDPKKGNLAALLRRGNVEDAAWGIQHALPGRGSSGRGREPDGSGSDQGGAAGCQNGGAQGHGADAGGDEAL